MPAELSTAPTIDRALAAISAVSDLSWAFYGVEKFGEGHQHKPSPWLERLARDEPALFERVRGFWAEGGAERGELFVLADRGGMVLGESLTPFLENVERLVREGIVVPELASEAPEIRELVQGRLDELRRSRPRRTAYVRLLREFWAYLEPEWTAALPGLRARVSELEMAGRRAQAATDVIPRQHMARREEYGALIEDAFQRGELHVTPLAFTNEGQYFYALPGLVLVGYGPGLGEKAAERRERAERSASRFKVLSDATRVAILNRIMHSPLSVTDLADYFELSQPTVSVHVKMLREAGLLESERRGNLTLYTASSEGVRRYVGAGLDELEEGLNC